MTSDRSPVDIERYRAQRAQARAGDPRNLETYQRRMALLKEHDARLCTCGHRCITHGSFDRHGFVGVGLGPCGWPRCDCPQFSPTGTSTHTALSPRPDYPRAPEAEALARHCSDCHAPPDELCHWACSSWWTSEPIHPEQVD
jgi:hypothetical protein